MSSLAAFAASITGRISPSTAVATATPIHYEFIKDRLYFTSLGAAPSSKSSDEHYFTVDNELVYVHFYSDTGPNNMAHVYRFIAILNAKLNHPQLAKKKIILYTSMQQDKRANAAYMLCCYMMLVHKQTPDEAYAPLNNVQPPFVPYRDAGYGPPTYWLSVHDSLRGLYRALKKGIFDFKSFDLATYEYYERIEHGDMNWVLPGKFLAFATPHDETSPEYGRMYNPYANFQRARIEDTIAYFKQAGVTTVVRLNNKTYDRQKFIDAGINHVEMYFPDGSTPPDSILYEFLRLAENTPGKIAIHCKAGLGRTGTLIAAYIMKHYHFTASEVISWLRAMRPGSVVGPQQNYLQAIQTAMWKQGPLSVSRSSELNTDKYALKNDAQSEDRIPRSETSAAIVPTAELASVAMVAGQEMAVPIQPRKGVEAISQAMGALDVKEYTLESDAATSTRYNLRSGGSSSNIDGKRRKSASQSQTSLTQRS